MTHPSTRLPDWQSRLAACIEARRAAAFAWGRQDCVQFAAACVHAVTGRDLAAEAPAYASEREARRVLKRLGGVRVLAAERLGQEVLPLCAQPGDIGLVNTPQGEGLAVCAGATWLAPGEHGLVVLPLAEAITAWRVC